MIGSGVLLLLEDQQSAGTVPADPTGLGVTIAFPPGHATLSWTDNATNETSVHVEAQDVTAGASFAEIVALDPNTTSYEDDRTFSQGHLYGWRVFARNATGDSGYTATVYAVPSPSVALGPFGRHLRAGRRRALLF